MREFEGAVAVVTGGGSGIGLALAGAALQKGARVVLADIRADALREAEDQLARFGGEVMSVPTDVSSSEEIEALAERTVAHFGKVNLLFNNAGVFASGLTWEVSAEEYDWVLDVNLRSVIHGIRTFVPRMIDQGDPCHVINTASGAGITANPGFCTYSMTKHAVVALSETLWLDLATQHVPNIGVTVVMPGVVQSGIMFPEKTGPEALSHELASRKLNPVLDAVEAMMRNAVNEGLSAAQAAEQVFSAIAENRLYVLPNFDGPDSRALSESIALGRARGENAYAAILPQFLAGLTEA